MTGSEAFLRTTAPMACAVVASVVSSRFLRLAGVSWSAGFDKLLDDPAGLFAESFEHLKLFGMRHADPATERWRLLAIAALALTGVVIVATFLPLAP